MYMQIEFEVKVLDVDVDSVRTRLLELGANKIGEFDSRRFVYDFSPVKENSWLRLREQGQQGQQGAQVQLTIKEIEHDGVEGTRELEVLVEDFDKMHAILQKLGYQSRAYQENRRESWELDGVQVEIDFWPRIPAYVEVEGDSEESVMQVLAKLQLNDGVVTSENTTKVYARYGLDLQAIKDLRFE